MSFTCGMLLGGMLLGGVVATICPRDWNTLQIVITELLFCIAVELIILGNK